VAANETLAGLDVDQFICLAIVKRQKLMSKNVASTRSEERSVASLPRQKDISALSVAPSEFDARLVHVSTLHRPPAAAPGTSSALASMCVPAAEDPSITQLQSEALTIKGLYDELNLKQRARTWTNEEFSKTLTPG
jgi:hypothetical protein